MYNSVLQSGDHDEKWKLFSRQYSNLMFYILHKLASHFGSLWEFWCYDGKVQKYMA